MYAVRIEPGNERIRVRSYRNGFLPFYVSSAKSDMGKRMLVVPGYIFTITKVGGAEKVPDQEWAMIEAISDRNPPVLDMTSRKFIDGPLKDLQILRVNRARKTVCIRAELMGMTRDYCLAVKFDSPASAPAAGKQADADMNKSKEQNAEEQNMDMNEIINRAKEIGLRPAAAEAGIAWQTIMHAAKKAGVEIPRKSSIAKPVAKKAAEKTVVKAAAKAPAAEPKKALPEKAAAPAIKEKPADSESGPSALEIENAVLRAENEKLRLRIQKLQKALAELI